MINTLHILDPISLPPTLEHKRFGRAWRIDLETVRKASRSGADACIAFWVIEARWAHPFWHSYVLSAIHLRPVTGLDPPAIYLPGATHELLLHALDPNVPREPNVMACKLAGLLTPANFAAQFIVQDDRTACQRVRGTVEEILAGKLSPDTDHRSAWVERYGDNMIRKAFRGPPSAIGTVH